MSKELLRALVDVLDDLKLREKLNAGDTLNISDSVLLRAVKAIENYPAQYEPLTYDQLEDLVDEHHGYPMTLGRAVEKAHGIVGAE